MMRCTTFSSETFYIGFGNLVKIIAYSENEQVLFLRKVWSKDIEILHFEDDAEIEEYLNILMQGRRY